MAKNNNLTDFVTDLANEIRYKANIPVSRKINPQDFAEHITDFPSTKQYKKYLEPLNQTHVIAINNSFMPETIEGVPLWVYYDESRQMQLFPVLYFTFTQETFIPGTYVEIREYTTDGTIDILSESKPAVTIPVVAFCNTSQNNRFDMPGLQVYVNQDTSTGSGSVQVKVECEWLTMGLPYNSDGDMPIFSAATMRGVIET